VSKGSDNVASFLLQLEKAAQIKSVRIEAFNKFIYFVGISI
jgi:hypothetical protein